MPNETWQSDFTHYRLTLRLRVSTLWTVGAWGALRRHSLQQELNLAKELAPSSPARAAITTHVEQELAIYLYRMREKPPPKVRSAVGVFLLAFVITAVISSAFPDANTGVIYVVEGLLASTLVWVYIVLMRSLWIRWSRCHHASLLLKAQPAAPHAAAEEGLADVRRLRGCDAAGWSGRIWVH